MNLLGDIFANESQSLLRELSEKLDSGKEFGSFSPTIYDTAWLARVIRTTGDGPEWLFPECFEYLLQLQQPDGGWSVHTSEMDGILNNMAALIALKEHRAQPKLGSNHDPANLDDRTRRAESRLRSNLQSWDVSSTVYVGFEILVPALLEQLETKGIHFAFQGRQTLMSMNQRKVHNFRPEMVYSPHKTTLVHSLEALVGKIDFDRVSHHLDQRGSMMGSPAATAAYLMNGSTWDDAAEAYLKRVVMASSGMGSGGVPGAFPSSFFELTWASLLPASSFPPNSLLATDFFCTDRVDHPEGSTFT